MAVAMENPPHLNPVVEDGYIKLTPQEWAQLMMWLQKFKNYTQENLP